MPTYTKKISELTEKTSVVVNDLFAIVDSAADPIETKKLKFQKIYDLFALVGHNHAGVYEPVIAAGLAAQYWRGDKAWATLNQAAVAGLTTADAVTHLRVRLTGQSAVSCDDLKNNFDVPNATFIKVPYASELYDNRNEYDAVTNFRFTALEAGDYLVDASLFLSGTPFEFEIDIYKNGSRENNLGASPSAYALHGSRVIRLAANDYIEIWVLQNSGVTKTFIKNNILNFLTINKIN